MAARRLRAVLVVGVASGVLVAIAQAAPLSTGSIASATGSAGHTVVRGSATKPSVRIGVHPKRIANGAAATFTFSSNDAKAKFVCSLDKRAYTPCRTPKSYGRLADGRHVFAVKASVRGHSSAAATFTWTVATVPTARIDASPTVPAVTSSAATFTFSSDHARATFQCSLDTAAYASCTSPKTYAGLAWGHHTFAVKASASGLSSDAAKFDWTIALRPGGGGDPAALANTTTAGQVQQYLNGFFSQYGMTVAITDVDTSGPFRLTWAPVAESDLEALKAYAAALVDEWGKYPLEWARVIHVRALALVVQLAVVGTRRAAAPDPIADVMFYDIGYASGDYAREVIHHELDHLLTYNLFSDYAPSDPVWLALNPPGFRYGNGGASCYVPGNTCLTGQHPIPGFVSGYSASAIEEDKAEVYGYLMETNAYWLVKSWVASDAYLAAKVANYERLLCGLSAAMCGSYFEAINAR